MEVFKTNAILLANLILDHHKTNTSVFKYNTVTASIIPQLSAYRTIIV